MKSCLFAVCAAVAFLAIPFSASGQNQAAPAADGDRVSLQLPDMPLPIILAEYERLTGMRIILDATLENEILSIETSAQMTRSEAAAYIEKSLLLNGFVLVPGGAGTLKIVSEANDPRREGVPVITRIEDLPETDQLVTYILDLKYVNGDEAMQAFVSIVPNHTYGKITPLPSRRGLAITESSSSIRNYLDLIDHIDVPPEERVTSTFRLERENVAEVAEKLTAFLGIGASDGGASIPESSGNGGEGPSAQPQPADRRSAVKPRITTIERTNTLMVVAHPLQMAYIEGLIQEFDAPAPTRTFMTRTLSYLTVLDFFGIAEDALLRDGQKSGGVEEGVTQAAQTAPLDLAARGIAAASQAGSRTGSGSGYAALAARRTLSEPEDLGGPKSLVLGKTILIADPAANVLYASGPPEHLKLINDLLDQIDQKPRQVMLSTVIGQLRLEDDLKFGFDIARTIDEFNVNGKPASTAGIFKTRDVMRPDQGLIDPSLLTTATSFVPATQGLTFYGTYGDHLNVFIEALEMTGRFRILSRPTVFTLNNRKAIILSGQRVAIPVNSLTSLDTGTVNPSVASNIQYEEVALRLEVIPLINSDDEVTLQISQINDDIIGTDIISDNEIPRIGTQELLTTVIVKNKSTVLLGGLISEDNRRGQTGLPLLVKVPILKHLTGSTTKGDQREELLIFIQPEIVVDEAGLADASQKTAGRARVAEETLEFAEPPKPAGKEAKRDGFFSRWRHFFSKKPD